MRRRRSKSPKRRRRSKSPKRRNKLTIHAVSSSLSIYNNFRKDRVINFVDRYKFVNGTFKCKKGKITIILKGFQKVPPYRKINWDSIKCRYLTKNIKISPCWYGSNQDKIFYKKARDLKDYITKLNNNIISYNQHTVLIKAMFMVLPSEFINSNGELAILHFKEH